MQSNIILDSGAYTAWTCKKEIDINAYCRFLHENADWVTNYISLDVINPKNPSESAKQSFSNWQFMREQGLRPIPVFHIREDVSWLHRYLDAGAEFISLSNNKVLTDNWYDAIWGILTNSNGDPVLKVHALGEGKIRCLKSFPWYSSDSTTWLYKASRHGELRLPGGHHRTFAFRNDRLHTEGRRDIERLDEVESARFKILLNRIGLSEIPERNEYSRTLRMYICALYYMDIEDQINATTPIIYHSHGLLHTPNNRPGITVNKFSLHLVTGKHATDLGVILAAKVKSWLISYYYLQRKEDQEYLRKFVTDPMLLLETDEKLRDQYNYIQSVVGMQNAQ